MTSNKYNDHRLLWIDCRSVVRTQRAVVLGNLPDSNEYGRNVLSLFRDWRGIIPPPDVLQMLNRAWETYPLPR